MNDSLPKDPMMLYSFVNMKLRDEYSTLDEMCIDLGIDKDLLLFQLNEVGFQYDEAQNRFW